MHRVITGRGKGTETHSDLRAHTIEKKSIHHKTEMRRIIMKRKKHSCKEDITTMYILISVPNFNGIKTAAIRTLNV